MESLTICKIYSQNVMVKICFIFIILISVGAGQGTVAPTSGVFSALEEFIKAEIGRQIKDTDTTAAIKKEIMRDLMNDVDTLVEKRVEKRMEEVTAGENHTTLIETDFLLKYVISMIHLKF